MNQTVCLICVKKDFVQKYTRTNLKAMPVSVVGAKLWNELDSNLRNIKTILLFKKNSYGMYYPRTYYNNFRCYVKTSSAMVLRACNNTDGRCIWFISSTHPWLHSGNLQRKKDPYKYGIIMYNNNTKIGA